MLFARSALVVLIPLSLGASSFARSEPWMQKPPGSAQMKKTATGSALFNSSLEFMIAPDGSATMTNRATGEKLLAKEAFAGTLGSSEIHSSAMQRIPGAGPHRTSRGIELRSSFNDDPSGITASVTYILANGANYVREVIQITAKSTAVDVSRITLPAQLEGAKRIGSVPGSPVASASIFAGLEHPMSDSVVDQADVKLSLARKLPLQPNQSIQVSAVFGVAEKGQLRRAFLRYTERERAHPYRPFLHYNSWYDIGYFTPYTDQQCVDRINAFGENLTRKRGVKLDSFLFDDGWDNYNSVWDFSKDFPNGFLPLKAAAEKYGADPGVWLSPWGGYGHPRQVRLAFGKAHGMEVDTEGYALSGPNYYPRFHEVTLNFVKNQGINQFKFDGTGSPDKQYPGSAFQSDFDAAISLIGDLRAAKPDLFINLTTGTWPSPFWTRFADSIWRGGEDHSFAGVGTWRQKWITYKDGDTYNGVVLKGPLYPLNSLMLHGIIYAQNAHNLNTDPGNDFADEVHEYFATGTDLQEMYISPNLLSEQNWNDLAETAKWARSNADVLVDTHWVGGDPTKLEVYGHAAWNGKKGIIVLRNPSDKPQAFSLDIARLLELPGGAKLTWSAKQLFTTDPLSFDFVAGPSTVVMLKPFQVLAMEGLTH